MNRASPHFRLWVAVGCVVGPVTVAQGRPEAAQPVRSKGELEPIATRDRKAKEPWQERLSAGTAALERGEFVEAESQLRAALKAIDGAGDADPRVAEPMAWLAWALLNQGKRDESGRLLDRVLALVEKTRGEGGPELVRAYNLLASYYVAVGEIRRAKPLLTQALSLADDAHRVALADRLVVLNNLAEVAVAQGDDAEAETLLRRASAAAEGPGIAEPLRGNVMRKLAHVVYRRGRLEDAEHLARAALATQELTLGPQHPEVADALETFARILTARGVYHDAEQAARRSLSIREHALGREDPAVANSLKVLADLYARQNRNDEVEPLARRALATAEHAFGPDSPALVSFLAGLAEIDDKNGHACRAEAELLRAARLVEHAGCAIENNEYAGAVRRCGALLREHGRDGLAEDMESRIRPPAGKSAED